MKKVKKLTTYISNRTLATNVSELAEKINEIIDVINKPVTTTNEHPIKMCPCCKINKIDHPKGLCRNCAKYW